MPAHYASSAADFVIQSPVAIVGQLTMKASAAGFLQQFHTQTKAWNYQLAILQEALTKLATITDTSGWNVLLEYPIPRRGKRIDTVLLLPGCIVVVEFKCWCPEYERDAIVQVEDYCLDLRDFHRESFGRIVVPLVVATEAPYIAPPPEFSSDLVTPTWKASKADLAEKLTLCESRYPGSHPCDMHQWDKSDYAPTPTIVEAAQALYADNNVREISRCHAGIQNLTTTSDAVLRLIDTARRESGKLICFVTGVPGSGKTLAGLNVVHNHGLHEGELGVFLSGNGPLVRVLTEALARDHRSRTGTSLSVSRRHVSTFIQNVHRFIDEYFGDPLKVPVDRVAVFDEAQRAWSAEQSLRKFQRNFSEPEIMLEVMDRHSDWAVIVALVGVGQEINSGEAGLGEWGRALTERFAHWKVAISPELKEGIASGTSLFTTVPSAIQVDEEPALNLAITLRSYKGERLSDFVNSLLVPDPDHARVIAAYLSNYPMVMTRSLEAARSWLKQRQRGSRRIGLIASSGARRLLAHGLDVTADLNVEDWFLNPADDVRSSFYLEVPATEFGIQGLELDWTGLCWGADLVPEPGGWMCRRFRGTIWQQVRNAQTRQYVVNKYRVLLTRAREGMVIWVPQGSSTDATRPLELYDRIASYLQACGVPALEDQTPSRQNRAVGQVV